MPESLFNKVAGLRSPTLLKRDSGKGVFLWILWHFYRHLFLQNTPGGCLLKTGHRLCFNSSMKKTELTYHSYRTSAFAFFRLCMLKFEKRLIKRKLTFHNIKHYINKILTESCFFLIYLKKTILEDDLLDYFNDLLSRFISFKP